MENITIKKMLQEFYHSHAYTDQYILGYTVNGTVYVTIGDSTLVDEVLSLDKASRGQGYALRFKPNRFQKDYLMVNGETFPLCSVDFFNDMVLGSVYNKGEVFEKLVTEYFGQEWTKDNVPYTEAGDITVDGVDYQIKYEKATFTNEKSMNKMRTRG